VAATVVHPAGSASSYTSSQVISSQSVSRSPTAAGDCSRWSTMTDSGLWLLRSSAASSIGLYSTMREGSMPQLADTTTFGSASSMRAASSCGAKPPKTTECTAPSRAHASIATTASGTIGM
jgi:hypothetical protein